MHNKDNKKPNPDSAVKTKSRLDVAGSNWEKFKHLVNVKNTPKDAQNDKHENHNHKPRNNKKLNYAAKAAGNKKKNMENLESVFETADKNVDKNGVTKHIAMDCEMVGIGDTATDSMIARVSIVNRYGVTIYDKYVKPTEPVTDYRTAVSGIRPFDIENGESFNVVQNEVAQLLKGRILVGHSLKNDLDVLFLKHPRRHMRDTSRYKPFRKFASGNTPSLKKLASTLLGLKIQTGEHNSVIDARTAMQLYLVYKNKWEADIRNKNV